MEEKNFEFTVVNMNMDNEVRIRLLFCRLSSFKGEIIVKTTFEMHVSDLHTTILSSNQIPPNHSYNQQRAFHLIIDTTPPRIDGLLYESLRLLSFLSRDTQYARIRLSCVGSGSSLTQGVRTPGCLVNPGYGRRTCVKSGSFDIAYTHPIANWWRFDLAIIGRG